MITLSRADNFRLFTAAKKGIKYSPTTIERLGLTRKRYYRALSELNRHGLIYRNPDTGMSVQSVFGEIIHGLILQIDRYATHFEELRMVDTLRYSGSFKPDQIARLMAMAGWDPDIVSNIAGSIEMVWSYKGMVRVLMDHLLSSKNQILVATRLLSEEVMRVLLSKTTHGVKVRVLSDVSLVESYFAMQSASKESSLQDNHQNERVGVIGNPWYPDKRIERRITKVPFGLVVIDDSEVGMELVDAHNTQEFSRGIILKDKRIAESLRDYYDNMWNEAEEFTAFYSR
jgi:hypothetical protein